MKKHVCVSGQSVITEQNICHMPAALDSALPPLSQVHAMISGPKPLADGRVAAAYASAVSEMLPRALNQLSAAKRSAGYTGSSSSSTAALLADAASAVARLWPLGHRAFLVQMFDSLERHPPAGAAAAAAGLESFALMCDTAMRVLPDLSRALAEAAATPRQQQQRQQRAAAAEVPNVLNTLAFAPSVLPRLWRWLGPALGLPLEAPLAATKGLDVASLAAGFRGMPRGKATVLGLLCRWSDRQPPQPHQPPLPPSVQSHQALPAPAARAR